MENQHKMISGYRDLSQDEIDVINRIKEAENQLGELWQIVMDEPGNRVVASSRWMNIAKTHLEQGFMAFVRAVARPEDRF